MPPYFKNVATLPHKTLVTKINLISS